MAKQKSKNAQKSRKGNKGKSPRDSNSRRKKTQPKSGISFLHLGLAVIAVLMALAGAYYASSSKRASVQMAAPPAEDLDIWEWDVSKVLAYVRKQGKQYKRFAAIIESQGLNGNAVLDLTPEDLKKLGFAKNSVRNKMWKLVNTLRTDSGSEGVMTLDEAQRRDPNHSSLSGNVNPDNTNFGATDKPSFCRLNRWLSANGADLSKCYLDPEQRILRVRRKINKGEVILTVPPMLFMSTVLARTDSKLVQILEKEMELGTHSLISIYLLEEMKNKDTTFWQPYIDVIPETFEDIPIFWADNDVKELQGDARSRYKRRRETLKNDYDTICDRCPGFKDTASLEEFMWARTAVITRTYGINVNGQKITTNLPIDFVMHANDPDTTWGYDQKKGCYHITAVRDIPKDKFLTITYGKKANSRFLVNYGFCLPVNSRNKGHLPVHVPGQWSGKASEGERLDKFEVDISEKSVTDTTAKCLEIVKPYMKSIGNSDGMELRKTAWRYLFEQTESTRRAYPTSLEHDLKELKRDDLSQNVRNAVLSRSGEKLVVDFFFRLAQEALNKFAKVEEDCKRMSSTGADTKAIRNAFAREIDAFPKSFTQANLIVDPTK